jgi:hypothetical protein
LWRNAGYELLRGSVEFAVLFQAIEREPVKWFVIADPQ